MSKHTIEHQQRALELIADEFRGICQAREHCERCPFKTDAIQCDFTTIVQAALAATKDTTHART